MLEIIAEVTMVSPPSHDACRSSSASSISAYCTGFLGDSYVGGTRSSKPSNAMFVRRDIGSS
jgi:hypothetical protein